MVVRIGPLKLGSWLMKQST